jgi:hypothetical protein
VDLLGRVVVPPVARWDWDRDNDFNYIGVKCDSRTWCEIGPEDFEPSEAIEILDQSRTKRAVIKGYYDQQYLADVDGDEPTNVFGTIFPGEHLKGNGQIRLEPSEDTWYHVAKITFEETTLYPGASGEFRRYIRRYKADGVFPVQWFKHGRNTPYEVQLNPTPVDPQDIYLGRLNNRALPSQAIRYHYHPGLKDVPPTVRWRWDLADEMTWFSCPAEGCCEKVKLLAGDD